jgi:hypothetical protein
MDTFASLSAKSRMEFPCPTRVAKVASFFLYTDDNNRAGEMAERLKAAVC